MANVVSPAFLGLTASLDFACDLVSDPSSGVSAKDLGLSKSAVTRYSRIRARRDPSSSSNSSHQALPIVARRSPQIHTDGSKEGGEVWQLGDQSKRKPVVAPGSVGAVVTDDIVSPLDGMQALAQLAVVRMSALEEASKNFLRVALPSETLTVERLPACATALNLLVHRLSEVNALLSAPEVSVDLDDEMMRTLQMARHRIEVFLNLLARMDVEVFRAPEAEAAFLRIAANVMALASFDGVLTQLGAAAAFWNDAYLAKITATVDSDGVAPDENLRLTMINFSSAVDTLVVNLTQNQFMEEENGMANLMGQVERVFELYLGFERLLADNDTLDADMLETYLNGDVALWVNSALGQLASYDHDAPAVNHQPLQTALLALRSRFVEVISVPRLFNLQEWVEKLLLARVVPSLEFAGVPSRPQQIDDHSWQTYLTLRRDLDVLMATVSGEASLGEIAASDEPDEGLIEFDDVIMMLKAATVATSSFLHCRTTLEGKLQTPAMVRLLDTVGFLLQDFTPYVDEIMMHVLDVELEDPEEIRSFAEVVSDFGAALAEIVELDNAGSQDDDEETSLGSWAQANLDILEGHFGVDEEDEAQKGATETDGDGDDPDWS